VDTKANFLGKLLFPVLVLASSACAATGAQAPGPEAPKGAPPAQVTAPPGVDPLHSPPPGLAPVPAACDAYATRKGEGKVACGDAASALAALDAALARSSPEQRDAALVDLEGCAGLPGGVPRALRAELAPIECSEAILEPYLKAPPADANGIVYGAMLGQAVASRLARAAQSPPVLSLPHDRVRVLEFIKGPMRDWLEQQALAIETISHAAAELPQYGKGVAAIEAGVADLRLVEAVRGGPIPDDFKRDEELKTAYYGSLDQMLDPRKDRGRDAALVGLKELALVGVIHDARVDRARTMLARLYGGRRIDALDALLLPALPRVAPASLEERLAARLPTLYAGLLLDEQAARRPGTLRQLLDKGVPLPQQMALRAGELEPAARVLYARAHLEMGRLYWRAVDFDQAAAMAASARAAAPSDDAAFTLALAQALRNGPDDAADMMRKAPRSLPPAQSAALDALAAQTPKGPYAGLAAFDAALVHQLASPEGAGAAYWNDVAQRFHAAAGLLADPAQRALAHDRAKAAEAVAHAVAEAPARR
jgi:tetratricopeptide (TPR) repeat protein